MKLARNLQNFAFGLIRKLLISALVAFSFSALSLGQSRREASAPSGYDVFNPITKYIRLGDAEKLSAWFSDNLEITVFSVTNNSSKNQAKQILKSFFASYAPRSFNVEHTAGRDAMKYALGTLKAGGETFQVTVFVSRQDSGYLIQQLNIEKQD